MPPKTKTQLKDELEQARRELAEVQAKTQAEAKAAREKLQETERQLKRELEETRQRAMESERELDEAITELSLEQDKVESLQASLREARSVKSSYEAIQMLPQRADQTTRRWVY